MRKQYGHFNIHIMQKREEKFETISQMKLKKFL